MQRYRNRWQFFAVFALTGIAVGLLHRYITTGAWDWGFVSSWLLGTVIAFLVVRLIFR